MSIMKKQNLREMLKQYSEQELNPYEEYDEMPAHSFSREYREKMSKMEGRRPVHRTGCTFAYRLAMACVCVIVALMIVNQASAYVFGITLWGKLMESAPEEMVTTIYQEKEGSRNKKGSGKNERLHDIPTEIPEGYELVNEKIDKENIVAIWQSSDNSQFSFLSYGINQNLHMYDNGEWETEETVAVAGYQGKIYARLTRSYLLWDDEKYHNNILSTNMSKEQVLAIAESLYKE